VLIALQTRQVMGELTNALLESLPRHIELLLVCPDSFSPPRREIARLSFEKSSNRYRAALEFANPAEAESIARAIIRARPDVVHVLNGEGYPWVVWWALRLRRANIPLAVTLHDVTPHFGNPIEWMTAQIRRPVLRATASVQIHSKELLPDARKITAAAIEVIPIGSLASPYLKHRTGDRRRAGGDGIVLFFGRLETYKGIGVLVAASEMLPPGRRVVIAGPGRLPPPLREQIIAKPQRFELYEEYLSEGTVARLFERSSVCVLPYLHVSQSAVPLLAAAFGVPVVGSALGGFKTDIPAVGGILVPPGDPVALADGILGAIDRVPINPPELSYDQLAIRFADWYSRLGRGQGHDDFLDAGRGSMDGA
jgi:glycosyltransferase involved in cell wall biosynthesis